MSENATSINQEAVKKLPQVGYGAASINADWPIGLLGYGTEANRISIGNRTDIFAIAVAMTDAEGNTALIVSLDSAGGDDGNFLRDMIEEKFGIPQDHVIVTAIHPHSTPCWTEEYVDLLLAQTEKAVAQAMADRAPAEMFVNKRATMALNFVRNYICNDGSCWGPNYGDKSSGLKCHESEVDREMRMVKFVREGKPPIIMVNFQTHPLKGSSGKDPYIHGDWPAIMRQHVAAKLGAQVIYISGAGGNVDSSSSIPGENISADWIDHGRRAAEVVLKAEETYRPMEFGTIKVKSATIAYETDHSMDHLIEEATIVENIRLEQGIGAAHAAAKKYPTLHSGWHAKHIVLKSKMPRTMDLTIGAITMGELAFTFHPYEMFDTNGYELRNGTVGNPNYEPDEQLNNPFGMTFVCTLGNGHIGYVPSRLGFTNGGYSTDITKLAPGGGERLVGDYLAILNDLHK